MGTDFGTEMELIYFPCTGRTCLTKMMLKVVEKKFMQTDIGWKEWDAFDKTGECPRNGN